MPPFSGTCDVSRLIGTERQRAHRQKRDVERRCRIRWVQEQRCQPRSYEMKLMDAGARGLQTPKAGLLPDPPESVALRFRRDSRASPGYLLHVTRTVTRFRPEFPDESGSAPLIVPPDPQLARARDLQLVTTSSMKWTYLLLSLVKIDKNVFLNREIVEGSVDVKENT